MKQLNIVPLKYEDEKLIILDQTKLPNREEYIEISSREDIFDAIKKLKVRGAPAIGVAAAFGLAVSVRGRFEDIDSFEKYLFESAKLISSARPTAVNLSWAIERLLSVYKLSGIKSVKAVEQLLIDEAKKIRDEDEAACLSMGEYGLSLLKPGMGILTHCNAGTIATAKYGTCLSPVYLGSERGYDFKLFADETRPLLQGARLTTWELSKAGVDVTLICDNMASIVMKNGWIDSVVVGCDRMAANGDGANKIGTSGVSILAKEYGIPFYMFVPTSTIDLNSKTGDDIEIELRKESEVSEMWYKNPMAPRDVKIYNPAFDVTPASNITAVITEKGIARAPYEKSLKEIMER